MGRELVVSAPWGVAVGAPRGAGSLSGACPLGPSLGARPRSWMKPREVLTWDPPPRLPTPCHEHLSLWPSPEEPMWRQQPGHLLTC